MRSGGRADAQHSRESDVRLAGLFLSLVGHAGLIALALWGLPWMRVSPEPPPEAVAVSLVSPAELAALVEGAREPPPAPEPAPPPPEPPRAAPAPAPPPPAEPPEPALPDLAPFNPDAPLGIVRPAETAPPPEPSTLSRATRPRPRPAPPDEAAARTATAPVSGTGQAGAGGAAPVAAGTRALDAYQAAVRAAIERAQVMPRAARDRGISGTARLEVSLQRDGRLARVRLAAPSGSGVIDAAALAAARRAVLPTPPPGLAVQGLRFVIDVRFTTNDG
jgi:protein TonB